MKQLKLRSRRRKIQLEEEVSTVSLAKHWKRAEIKITVS
jgi:hypothetical protein